MEKEEKMINVIVAGASGRMGQRVGYMVSEHPGLHYAAAFEAAGSPAIGRDPGETAGWGRAGISIAEGFEAVIDQGDVLIDFTFHKATMAFARLAARHNKAMVIGTTGLSSGKPGGAGRTESPLPLCPVSEHGSWGQCPF